MVETGKLAGASLAKKGKFPRSYEDFCREFPDEESCIAYLEMVRWPTGFICPKCQCKAAPWRQTRGRWVCRSKNCGHQTSVTAGTMLDKTHTPLTEWFRAIWLMATARKGMSAKALQKELGTTYKTAWKISQRCREMMAYNERERLSGIVEVDEILVNVVEQGKGQGRGGGQAFVLMAVEVGPKGPGRIRMRHVTDISWPSLERFIRDVIKPEKETRVCTDGWEGYDRLEELGYVHEKMTPSSSSCDLSKVVMPNLTDVAGRLKEWLLKLHQGSIVVDYLQCYLDEFTFVFNRHASKDRTPTFRRLIEQAVKTENKEAPYRAG